LIQELLGREVESIFQTQDIVRRQVLIQITAATIKARHLRVARKSEGII